MESIEIVSPWASGHDPWHKSLECLPHLDLYPLGPSQSLGVLAAFLQKRNYLGAFKDSLGVGIRSKI